MSYQPRDTYFKRAKKEGYRSRAAYKLLELNQKYRLFKRGDRVVDLGAAPGGWLQVIAQVIGNEGKAVGVDLQPIEAFREKNIVVIQGDIADTETRTKIQQFLGGPADCVLSDLSPKLSGIHSADLSRWLELVETAFAVATLLLKAGGNFAVKTFEGSETAVFRREIKPFFASLHRFRSEATRKGSSEMYLVATGFRPPR